jgi:imidazolonepropionase-like amidohydrolase
MLVGGHVLDRRGEAWQDAAILVSGGRIVAIGAPGSLPNASTAQRLDVTGLWIVPGLIDLHTHFLLHPYDEASWDQQVLGEALEQRTIRATVAARRTLEAGFTTIRDLGTEGAAFADVALRDAIAQGMVPGPRCFVVTRAIVATGCYGPLDTDARFTLPKGAQEASGLDGVRQAVREQIAAGADWVKVYTDYRRGQDREATPTFSLAELEALVDEAHSAGRPVAAHATTEEGIRRAVEAGVATIEHGYGATDAVLSLMRQKKVVLCPTLAANEASARYAGWQPGTPEPARIVTARTMLQHALRAGVTIACGSDAGVFAHGDNARELELLVAYGMSPADALRSATSTAAAVLGHAADLGRLEAGYIADLIAVRGDPLRDPSPLRQPALVLAAGRVAIDRRDATKRP